MSECSVNPQWGTPKSPEKIQRRYTSALPGAQGLGACACSGSGGPLVLARGTFQRDSLRGGERFPRASSSLPFLLRGRATFLGGWHFLECVDCWCACRCLDPSDDHSPRQRCRGVDDLSVALQTSSGGVSSLARFYLTVSFSAYIALASECRPATPPPRKAPRQLYIRFSFVV